MTKKAFRKIEVGAKAALAIARGEAKKNDFRIHVPPAVDVKTIRRKLKLSQSEFCERFGFGLARLRDWEQHRSHPDGALRAYLLVIARATKAVEKALKSAA